VYGQDHNEVIRVLEEHWPRCFFDDPRQRRPIKKNILVDIEAQKPKELEPYDIAAAIDWYCGHYAYWKVLAMPGNQRIDLDGKPVDRVTELEAKRAIDEINRINAEKQARGIPNPHINGAAPLRKLDMIKPVPPTVPATDAELLASATKRLARVKECLADPDEDGLRAEMVIPLLKKAIDDAQTLLARMKG